MTSHVSQARLPRAEPLMLATAGRPADRREVAFVPIVERGRRLSGEAAAHDLCRVPAPLDRDRCHSWQTTDEPSALRTDHVAEREHVRMPGKREVGPTVTRLVCQPAPVSSASLVPRLMQ